jgi:uncharacterized protein YqeY
MAPRRTADELRERIGARLRFAMKDRDQAAIDALRGALAALANAESAGVTAPAPSATEAPRRELTDEEAEQIVRDEVAERETAAIAFRRAGESARADRLVAEAATLRALADLR